MKTINKKIIIIIVAFLLFIGLISVVYVLLNPSTNKDPSKDPALTVTYVDPGTGLTVITTPNKTPENVGGENITMLGLASLIDDYGMTLEQINVLKSEFKDYSSTLKTPISELSITLASIETTVNADTGDVTLAFTITTNRSSTTKAQVSYLGIGDPKLKIYDSKTNKLLYTSL